MKTWLQPSTNPTIYHLIQICHFFLSYFLSFCYLYQEHLTATVSRSNHLSSNTNKSLFLSYFLSLFYLHIRNTWLQPSLDPTIYHLIQISHSFLSYFLSLCYLHIMNTWLQPSADPTIYQLIQISHSCLSYFLSLFYLHIRNTRLQLSLDLTIYHLIQICHFFILIFIFMLSSDQEHLTATVPRSNHLSANTDPTFSYSLLS